jgi:8-oxo-dGTP pyrophosphatase MutT (NUDIX family)
MSEVHRLAGGVPIFPKSKEIAVPAVLYLRRSEKDPIEPGKWGIPGGHIKDGESPRAATIREVQEETGLSLRGRKLVPFGSFSLFIKTREGKPLPSEGHVFGFMADGFTIDDVSLRSSHVAKKLVDMPKLRQMKMAPDKYDEYTSGDREVIKRYLLNIECMAAHHTMLRGSLRKECTRHASVKNKQKPG